MLELAAEEGGESLQGELESGIKSVEAELAGAEIAALLSGPHDMTNAIVSIHPGAGGVEAQDWAEMLMRMYLRWAEKSGYGREILDYQSGEEAGVKSVTFTVSGDYAYGKLKASWEAGGPLGVSCTPEDVAEAILWLAEGARTVTGELVLLDAGVHLGQAPRIPAPKPG